MLILGIETSCDETAAAVVSDGVRVESSVISSSRDVFALAGGVVPEDAARRQTGFMIPVLEKALRDAGVTMKDIDAVAVTYGPGLLGSLLVGTTAARALCAVHNKPLYCVHHTLGHLTSPWLNAEPEPVFPCITLSASGGHTDLWYRTGHTEGVLLGSTLDDAAGEAFDKGAALLGLPYPGGPAVSRTAEKGNLSAFSFPVPLRGEDTLNFSFSGVKTALRYTIRDLDRPVAEVLPDLAASYQHSICLQLQDRAARALQRHPECKELHLVGGVAANTHLRALFSELPVTLRTPVTIPFCTDNAAMIAAAGFFTRNEASGNLETRATAKLSDAHVRTPTAQEAVRQE